MNAAGRRRIGALIAVLLLACLLPQGASGGPPPLPSAYWGTITIDGAYPPSGTPISAWINGVQYAASVTYTSGGVAVYSIDVPSDHPDTTAIEGGVEGDTVYFQVGGLWCDQTGVWHSGSYDPLNLTASSPVGVTPTPTNTPGITPTLSMPETPTPTSTPIPSDRHVWGTVREQTTRKGVADLAVGLYRHSGSEWLLVRQSTTDATGGFAWWISPVMTTYRIVLIDLGDYEALAATLPDGCDGNVIDAATVEFELATETEIGEFLFSVQHQTSPTPTATPIPTLAVGEGVIEGYVWGDKDGDGALDSGEALDGIEVSLAPVGQAIQAQRTTDASGYYAFDGLPLQNYELAFSDPQGRVGDSAAIVLAEALVDTARVDVVWRWLFLPWCTE